MRLYRWAVASLAVIFVGIGIALLAVTASRGVTRRSAPVSPLAEA